MNSYLVLELSSFCVTSFRSNPNISDHDLPASHPQTGIYCESFRDATTGPRDAVIWSRQTPISRGLKLTTLHSSPYAATYERKLRGPE